MKFIFNIAKRAAPRKAGSSTILKTAAAAVLRAAGSLLTSWLLLSATCPLPALAQQPDAPS
ncbi:MAG: hypothetical protein WA654_12690, partial [Candidatus Sulfotelmatobacter sp.]